MVFSGGLPKTNPVRRINYLAERRGLRKVDLRNRRNNIPSIQYCTFPSQKPHPLCSHKPRSYGLIKVGPFFRVFQKRVTFPSLFFFQIVCFPYSFSADPPPIATFCFLPYRCLQMACFLPFFYPPPLTPAKICGSLFFSSFLPILNPSSQLKRVRSSREDSNPSDNNRNMCDRTDNVKCPPSCLLAEVISDFSRI